MARLNVKTPTHYPTTLPANILILTSQPPGRLTNPKIESEKYYEVILKIILRTVHVLLLSTRRPKRNPQSAAHSENSENNG